MTTWTKLPGGAWGLRGEGLVAGAPVRVTKRNGRTKVVTVGEVFPNGTATVAEEEGVFVTTFAGGATVYRNMRGRCEDAPCCGCCT